jgi:hypothetical protein
LALPCPALPCYARNLCEDEVHVEVGVEDEVDDEFEVEVGDRVEVALKV